MGSFFAFRTCSCLHGGFFGSLLFHLGKSLSERFLLQLLDEVLLLRLWQVLEPMAHLVELAHDLLAELVFDLLYARDEVVVEDLDLVGDAFQVRGLALPELLGLCLDLLVCLLDFWALVVHFVEDALAQGGFDEALGYSEVQLVRHQCLYACLIVRWG